MSFEDPIHSGLGDKPCRFWASNKKQSLDADCVYSRCRTDGARPRKPRGGAAALGKRWRVVDDQHWARDQSRLQVQRGKPFVLLACRAARADQRDSSLNSAKCLEPSAAQSSTASQTAIRIECGGRSSRRSSAALACKFKTQPHHVGVGGLSVHQPQRLTCAEPSLGLWPRCCPRSLVRHAAKLHAQAARGFDLRHHLTIAELRVDQLPA